MTAIETIREYAAHLRGADRGARVAWEAVADALDAVPGGEHDKQEVRAIVEDLVEQNARIETLEKRADAFEAQVMTVIREEAGFKVAPEDLKVLRDANGRPISLDEMIDEAVDEAVDDAFD